jgi:hypothetical protein
METVATADVVVLGLTVNVMFVEPSICVYNISIHCLLAGIYMKACVTEVVVLSGLRLNI